MIKSLARLLEEANYEIETASRNLTKFAQKILDLKNPAYEMAWSGDAFAESARHQVWTILKEYATHENIIKMADPMATVIKEVTGNVSRMAMHPERSTSPASNLLNQEVMIAWAKALERLTK